MPSLNVEKRSFPGCCQFTSRSRLLTWLILPFVLPLIILLASCASMKPQPSTPDERARRADELFSNFDLDGDGFLTRTELESGLRYLSMGIDTGPAPQVMMGLRTENRARTYPPRPKPKHGLKSEDIEKAVTQAFKKTDHVLDQRLSRDEFKKLIVERPKEPDENDIWEPLM